MSREMKDSGIEWLGNIPKGWKIVPSKSLFFNSSEKVSGDTLQLTASQKYGVISQESYMRLEAQKPVQKSTKTELKKVDKNDFVISLRSFEGGIELAKESGGISPAYTILKAKGNSVNFDYYKFLFKSVGYIQGLRGRVLDTIRDGKSIKFSHFSEVPLVLPSTYDQKIISNFLDQKTSEIDNLIEQTKQSIEAFKAYKQSLITETVTKGLDPDVPMKDSGVEWIGEIPRDWEVAKLKHFSTTNDESLPNQTPSDYYFRYVDIGSVSLENGVESYENTSYKNAPSRARRIVKTNDIIVSTVRTYLKAIAVIDDSEDVIVSTGFAVIRPNNINSNYLAYFIKSDVFTEKVNQLSEGIAYPSITSEKLMNISITIPNLETQLEIGDYLDRETQQIDSLITKKESMVKELESYKQSLIYEYVTGKKEVK